MKKEETKNYLVAGTLNNCLEKKILNKKSTSKGIVAFLAFGVTAIASLGALTVSLPACISLAAVAATVVIYENKIAKKIDNTESRLKQENKHIEKLLNDEINLDDKSNEKRKKKLTSLSKLSKIKYEKEEFYNMLSIIIYGITITFSVPVAWLGGGLSDLLVPLSGVLFGALVSNAEIKAHKECEVVDNRINNLTRDLAVVHYEKYGKTLISEKEENKSKNELCKTYDLTNEVRSAVNSNKATCFGITEEEFYKLYEENNGFDVRYPDEKPKEYSKSKNR